MATSSRPLLPKSQESPECSDAQEEPTRRPSLAGRKRANTTNACDVCRRRKTKCDGQHPICSTCVKLGAACTYSVPRRSLQRAAADRDAMVLHQLRTLPYDKAIKLLETLRADGWESGMPTSSLSFQESMRNLLAPTRNTLEFELTVRHPVAYPPLFPLHLASLPLESLLTPSRISVIRGPCNSSPSGQRPLQVVINPFPIRPLVDERLRKLDMSYWSEVPITNELAANIISLYIETDYQTLPLFDLDLFLEDLVHNQPRFCSSLLISSLLSWACQAYTAINSEAHILGRAFFNQAQQLIPDGPELITLTAVSALTLLCIAAMGYGRDLLAFQFLQQSVEIGVRMGLFGNNSAQGSVKSASTWLGDHEDWSGSASYTAWGVHNWISLYCLRYRSSDIYITPKIPMPELSSQFLNVDAFRACSELWVISNDMTRKYYHNNDADDPLHRQQFIENTFQRLLAWADALPLHLVRSDGSTHAVMMMHIYFHIVIVDLFRHYPTTSRDHPRLSFFNTVQATPRAVYAASINQLKRLLLTFRLSFEAASLSILSQTVLIYVCNAVVREARSSDQLEWHIYLRLCLAALQDLFGSYRESWTVTRGLLSMAIDHGALLPEEAQRITREMLELGRHHSACDEVDTRSIVDLDLAITNIAAARGVSLAGQFEEQLLEENLKN